MNIELKGKRALVCGGSDGIGKAIALELASLGASCTLFARNEEKLNATKKLLDISKGQLHEILLADFNHLDDVRKVIQTYTKPIDILINNSGGPKAADLLESNTAEFLSAFSQHVLTAQILVQHVIPQMKHNGYGRIVNIISTSVRTPIKGLGVSNTIRGAMASWSKTLSNEVAPWGITVNNVLPGLTETGRLNSLIEGTAMKQNKTFNEVENDMKLKIPFNRFGKPEEISALAAFLCTPAASYITGVSIQADGGMISSI